MLFGDGCNDLRILLKELRQCLIDHGVHKALHIAVAEPHLCLAFKLRICNLDADDSSETFPYILTLNRDILFQMLVYMGTVVDGAGKC